MSKNKIASYLLTGTGKISAVINGNSYTVEKDHPNYAKILDAVKAKAWNEFVRLTDLTKEEVMSINKTGWVIRNIKNGRYVAGMGRYENTTKLDFAAVIPTRAEAREIRFLGEETIQKVLLKDCVPVRVLSGNGAFDQKAIHHPPRPSRHIYAFFAHSKGQSCLRA